ncbi:MAG: hypothetical protein WA030_03115 [Candidatus Microsaccharimonas sp.]
MAPKPHKAESYRHISKAEIIARKTAATTLIALGGFGLAGCVPTVSAGPSPSPTTTTSETAAPNPDNEQPSFEQQVETLRIPEGLSDEELAKAMLERQEAWANYGKSDKLSQERVLANLSYEDFLVIKAEENAQLFAAALLPKNWQDNPELLDYYKKSRDYNYFVLLAYVRTAWNGDEVPANKEGFETNFTYDRLQPTDASEGERGLAVFYTEDYNDEDNVVDPIQNPWQLLKATFDTVDGHEVVTSASVSTRYTQ